MPNVLLIIYIKGDVILNDRKNGKNGRNNKEL